MEAVEETEIRGLFGDTKKRINRDILCGGKKDIFKGKSLKSLDKLQINLLQLSLKYIFQKGIRNGLQTF